MNKAFFTGSSLLLIFLVGFMPVQPLADTVRGQSETYIVYERLDSQVRAQFEQMGPDDTLAVIVQLKDQVSMKDFSHARTAANTQQVAQTLRAQAQKSQSGILKRLQRHAQAGRVVNVTPYWIFNGLAVTATRQVIEELASLPEVQSITPDYILLAPEVELSPSAVFESNQTIINAPALWELGYQGEGIVVANLDTGVDYTHPDLVQQWRGGANSWFDPYGEHPDTPYDANGHGTWTMGIMVGRDNSGSFIGSAPEARWIAAKIFNDGGYASTAAIHLAFQWILDPDGDPATDDAPHVVNNSWSFMALGCYLDFQADLQALRAAGILPIFAAGNAGPDLASSVSPANYPESFAVGAVDSMDLIALSSSRGPSECGGRSGAFPDAVAPGVSIKSSSLDGGYSWATGTSLAAPHVAGGLALLLQAFPDMTVEEQEAALRSALIDLGDRGSDYTYGEGRFDALASLETLGGFIPDTGAAPNPPLAVLYLPLLTR